MLAWLIRICKRSRPKKIELPVRDADVTIEELQETLAQRALDLSTDGARLLFESPRPVLDDDLVTQLQRYRGTLVKTLPRRCA
jgi:hypothetical protein